MTIELTRQGVCMGDDIDSPHRELLSAPDGSNLEFVLKRVRDTNYLPQIQGGKATWTVWAEAPLAVIAQSEAEPLYLVDPALTEFGDHLRFAYHAQLSHTKMFRRHQKGEHERRWYEHMFGG